MTAAAPFVVLLTVATAVIHFYLVPGEFSKGATGYGTLFILTGLGYLLALAIMYAPQLSKYRPFGTVLLVGIAVAAIIAYVSLGYFDTLGWVTKAIEAALLLAVAAERLMAGKTSAVTA
jgi:hypothetical protein